MRSKVWHLRLYIVGDPILSINSYIAFALKIKAKINADKIIHPSPS